MLSRRDLLRQASWLMAGTIATPALLSILESCRSEPRLGYEPQYFSPEEAGFVAAYVDALLPRTETPGGLDVKVDLFIDRVLAATSPKGSEPSEIQKGIRAMEEESTERFGGAFAKLDPAQRDELFAAAEERSPRYNPQVWGTPVGEQPPIDFYRSFKSMVLWGYLSSETIGTEVLNYDPVPGGYDGDIPLESVGGRAWSL